MTKLALPALTAALAWLALQAGGTTPDRHYALLPLAFLCLFIVLSTRDIPRLPRLLRLSMLPVCRFCGLARGGQEGRADFVE